MKIQLLTNKPFRAAYLTFALILTISFQNDDSIQLPEADLGYIYLNATSEPGSHHGRQCIYMGVTNDSFKVNNGGYIGGINGLIFYTGFATTVLDYLVKTR